jgi:putative flavoprotein involved in K+ transport
LSAATGSRRYEVVVVGAGQAGLAIGYFLARRGLHFLIVEADDSVGSAWRSRWESLTLFTPRRYDSLPGLVFPGDPEGYPTRTETIAYLDQYAAKFELPIQLDSKVQALTRAAGRYLLALDEETIEAAQVVVATGPFQAPLVPPFAKGLAPEVVQMHSTGYRNPGSVPGRTVLVVGGGNTGFQIAAELAASHDVHLSVGSRQKPLPQRLLGRDLFWWLGKTGLLYKTVDSRLGRRLRDRGDVLIGSSPRALEKLGVTMRPRATAVAGRTITFADGTKLEADAVIWATGYQSDHSWIKLPLTDVDGRLQHTRGVSDQPGLYFLGLQWQHTRGSALLGWVKDDAEYLAAQVAAHAATADPGSRPAAAAA